MTNFSVDGDYFFPSNLFTQDHNHPLDSEGGWKPASGFQKAGNNGFKNNNDARCLGGACDINRVIENPAVKLRVYINELKKYMNYDSTSTNFE